MRDLMRIFHNTFGMAISGAPPEIAGILFGSLGSHGLPDKRRAVLHAIQRSNRGMPAPGGKSLYRAGGNMRKAARHSGPCAAPLLNGENDHRA